MDQPIILLIVAAIVFALVVALGISLRVNARKKGLDEAARHRCGGHR